ncbi:holo-ACP synthase [Sulfoacidibacillus thermotolerans]|uniref:Holo-[acyl-carrier-protein] synthase n=1 Tax=Sulfoacidibacillus thermotolerans TaxID=1765684 RepID=A0A2U3D6I4_SULT2|nr:holo-ACP synthase [Sulfoacidibacillus thermotolerans]PWI56873.1 hypothetical protein BM613_11600 [Sulfoacidibacillus thermotolerans]
MVQGVDIVEIARIARLAQRSRFLKRIYTVQELALIEGVNAARRAEILAGRFAAKEAVMKAFGSLLLNFPSNAKRQLAAVDHKARSMGVSFHEIETLSHLSGAPLLRLHGEAEQIARHYKLSRFSVSLSHTREVAIAFVILS